MGLKVINNIKIGFNKKVKMPIKSLQNRTKSKNKK